MLATVLHVDITFFLETQPKCTSETNSPVLPSDTVTLLCQVAVCYISTYKLKLTEGNNQLDVGSTTDVSWTGRAGNVTGTVTCSADTTGIQSQCPVMKGA